MSRNKSRSEQRCLSRAINRRVIDPVKERLHVHVYHPSPAFADTCLHVSNRLMGGTLRAESVPQGDFFRGVPVRVKMRFPLCRDNLRNGFAS